MNQDVLDQRMRSLYSLMGSYSAARAAGANPDSLTGLLGDIIRAADDLKHAAEEVGSFGLCGVSHPDPGP